MVQVEAWRSIAAHPNLVVSAHTAFFWSNIGKHFTRETFYYFALTIKVASRL